MPLFIALSLLVGHAPSAMASPEPTSERELARGLTVVTSAVAGAQTVAVTLELALGLDAEGEGSWGMTALALAALRDGPTQHLRAGEAVALGARAGLITRTALHRDRVAITLIGPADALPTALWLTAERLAPAPLGARRLARLHDALLASPDHAPSPPPPPLQHTLANLFGPLAGHSAWASHQRARAASRGLGSPTPGVDAPPREPDRDLTALAAMVADALPRASARVVIAASPAHLPAGDDLERVFGASPPRDGGPPARRDPSLDADWQAIRPARVAARHDVDSRRLVAVAWDHRGVARKLGIPAAREEALRRVLAVLLVDRGGVLYSPLVEGYGVARGIEVHIEPAPPALIVIATARGRSPVAARQRLLEALAPLAERGPPESAFLGAREVAHAELEARWATTEGRADLISAWHSADAPGPIDTYRRDLAEALLDVRPRDLLAWASHGLSPERQVVVELTPTGVPEQERVALDADTLTDYLRLLVDLRCPAPGRTVDLVALLDRKYGLTPERYVALTRVIAREPERMRELNHEAEQRCLEYRRLRELVPAARVVDLHRAITCDAGRAGDEARRERARDAVFRAYDLDPSVYRPLIAMAREDLDLAPALEAIDAECAPPHTSPRPAPSGP